MHARDVVQLVECALWEREVESSNLSVPTKFMTWQVLILLSFLLHGTRTYYNKRLTQVLPPILANFWVFFLAIPLSFLAKFLFHADVAFRVSDLSFLLIGALTGLSMVTLFAALRLSVYKTSLASSFNIVVTILLAALFLGEWQLLNPSTSHGLQTLVGIVLVLVALYLVHKKPKEIVVHIRTLAEKRWLVFITLNVLFSGVSGFLAKYFIDRINPYEAVPIHKCSEVLSSSEY